MKPERVSSLKLRPRDVHKLLIDGVPPRDHQSVALEAEKILDASLPRNACDASGAHMPLDESQTWVPFVSSLDDIKRGPCFCETGSPCARAGRAVVACSLQSISQT